MRGLMSTTAATIRIANDSPFCESRRAMKKLEDDLTSPTAMHATMSEIEQLMRTQSREMLRAIFTSADVGRIVMVIGKRTKVPSVGSCRKGAGTQSPQHD